MAAFTPRGCVQNQVFEHADIQTDLDQMTFTKCTFRGLVFSTNILRQCTFKECTLDDCRVRRPRGCRFVGCTISKCAFVEGISNCLFRHCQLGGGCKVENTEVLRTSFVRCGLVDASFLRSRITSLTLDRCILSRVIFDETNTQALTWTSVRFDKCSFRRACLSGGTLRRVRTKECTFEGSTLAHVAMTKGSFTRCVFSNAVLAHATWGFVDFLDHCAFVDTRWSYLNCLRCVFRGGDWTRAVISHTEFVHCTLSSCTFLQAVLRDCEFTCIVSSSVTWTDACCTNVTMRPSRTVRGEIRYCDKPHAVELIPWTQHDSLKRGVQCTDTTFVWDGVATKEIDFIQVTPQASWVPFSSKTDPHEIISAIILEGTILFHPSTRKGVRGFVRVRRPCSRRPLPRRLEALDLACN